MLNAAECTSVSSIAKKAQWNLLQTAVEWSQTELPKRRGLEASLPHPTAAKACQQASGN